MNAMIIHVSVLLRVSIIQEVLAVNVMMDSSTQWLISHVLISMNALLAMETAVVVPCKELAITFLAALNVFAMQDMVVIIAMILTSALTILISAGITQNAKTCPVLTNVIAYPDLRDLQTEMKFAKM